MVDDDIPILEVVSEALGDAGYTVVTATSATEALEKIRDDATISLLFSDVVMPGLSGVDLARQVAAIRPGLRIVLASGHAEGWIEGMPEDVDFIAKPYTPQQIFEALSAAETRTHELERLDGEASSTPRLDPQPSEPGS